MVFFYRYPTNYRDIAHDLLTTYPQLVDSLGVPEDKARVSYFLLTRTASVQRGVQGDCMGLIRRYVPQRRPTRSLAGRNDRLRRSGRTASSRTPSIPRTLTYAVLIAPATV